MYSNDQFDPAIRLTAVRLALPYEMPRLKAVDPRLADGPDRGSDHGAIRGYSCACTINSLKRLSRRRKQLRHQPCSSSSPVRIASSSHRCGDRASLLALPRPQETHQFAKTSPPIRRAPGTKKCAIGLRNGPTTNVTYTAPAGRPSSSGFGRRQSTMPLHAARAPLQPAHRTKKRPPPLGVSALDKPPAVVDER